jgi:hypothetical protein
MVRENLTGKERNDRGLDWGFIPESAWGGGGGGGLRETMKYLNLVRYSWGRDSNLRLPKTKAYYPLHSNVTHTCVISRIVINTIINWLSPQSIPEGADSILAALSMEHTVLCVVTPCNSERTQSFGGTFLMSLQVSLSAHSSTPEMRLICSSETSVSLRTTRRYKPEDRTYGDTALLCCDILLRMV